MQKEFLFSHRLLREILRHLAVFVGYALLFVALYALSKNFFTDKGWSTWFMPTGARLALLLILPWRYWPTLLFTEFLCNRGITHYYGNIPPELGYALLKWATTRALYVLPVIWLKTKFQSIDLAKPVYILAMLGTLVFQAMVNATDLVYFSTFYQSIPTTQKLEMWLSFAMGSSIGMLLVAPFMTGIYQLKQEQNTKTLIPLLPPILMLGAGLAGLYQLFHGEPGSMYLLIALCLIPMLYFAYRFGWVGSVLSLFTLNLFVGVSLYGQSGTLTMQQVQVFVLMMNAVGLYFGALIATQHQLNSELCRSLEYQQELTAHNLRLAEKFSTLQEDERKRVSDELHDDLGQSITALKLQTTLLAKQVTTDSQRNSVTQITHGIEQLYESVYRMMHSLRPRLLEVYGLKGALIQGALPAMLEHANIHYQCSVPDAVDSLPEHLKILLFRIAQEALTNIVKHSKANQCWLVIELNPHLVRIEVKDDGTNITQGISGGFGLANLQDRVSAYSGTLSFTQQKSTTLAAILPLPQQQQ